jgi:hypothetical protein
MKISKAARYPIAALSAVLFLWVAANTMVQSRLSMPGVSTTARLGFLLFGLPGANVPTCSEDIHGLYITAGPDGNNYPTWHPVYDREHRCVFEHEHGSDPHSYTGFPASGSPAFGYTASQAGVTESHAGYKVFVSNDDLLGHAWMIAAHQDTGIPERAVDQFHSLDWHISSLQGEPLVSIHVMADYGPTVANCQMEQVIYPAGQPGAIQVSQQRAVLTTDCASVNPYESWSAAVSVAGVFEASPLFDVENPITAVDPADFHAVHPTCAFRPLDERCEPPGSIGVLPWNGSRRGVVHPGQYVSNQSSQQFVTDAYGMPVDAQAPGAVTQFITLNGWDTRDCCGEDVVFQIQTWSDGLYVPSPEEPSGSAEFWYR